ncbi:MAG: DEAD/DEAH box helicase, partial [Alteraurantiacibacter sp. bin_em_oilr2.035]|nr:DEAD/DEAH box helicase [Alteraurantiacibacter sp. bin_em_oilr2.035]
PADLANANENFDVERLILDATKLEVIERVNIEPRPAKFSNIPEGYRTESLDMRLRPMMPVSRKLWSHQALALEFLDQGKNVLVTTGTGSGKSMIFQLPILREMIEGNGTALVLYPQKALGSDQLRRWQEALQQVGLDPDLVGEINGDVATVERGPITEKARILLVTPDVVHAWLLRHSKQPAIERFLKALTYVVIDEAHAYHGVMGSNSAYLFRRLLVACRWTNVDPEYEPRFIVASATLDDPLAFARKLAGVPFEHVSEELDGSPTHGLTLLHVDGPDRGPAGEAALAEVLATSKAVLGGSPFLAFADARQGVERICRALSDDTILPYRSGYEQVDRRAIETALHAGDLNGCVATSALEMGIDVAGFRAGFNLGVPTLRMALRQRAGRIGRTANGVFIVIAPANAFAKLGTSLDEYMFGPVEVSHLYLQNPLIQYQQARCLVEELGGSENYEQAFQLMRWPEGFSHTIKLTLPGAKLPGEIARIAQQCGASPHLSYPLRRINDLRMDLRLKGSGEIIGTIGVEQALREAYPGATYFHLRKGYRVVEWRTSSFERSIVIEPVKRGPPTSGIVHAQVGYSLEDDQVIQKRHLVGEGGIFAETHLRVTQTVIGYAIAGRQQYYSDLSKQNPRMRRQMRMFETTGVVLRLDTPAFAGPTKSCTEKRKNVGEALRSILVTSHGVQISDIGLATSSVSQFANGHPEKDENAIVLFDDIQGGLRLTEIVFSGFPEILERLHLATELAGTESMLDEATMEDLTEWYDELKFVNPDKLSPSPPVSRIFAPGSVVGSIHNGQLSERELLGHDHLDIGGQDMLMYRYDAGDGVAAWIAAEALHPVGDNWSYLSSDQMGEAQ